MERRLIFLLILFNIFTLTYAQDFLKFVNRKTNDTIYVKLSDIDTANVNGIRLHESAANKIKGISIAASYINIEDSNKWVRIPSADILASTWRRCGNNVILKRESVLAGIQSNSILYYGSLIYNELLKHNIIRKEDVEEYPW